MRLRSLEKEREIEELRKTQKFNEETRQLDLLERIRAHEERIRDQEESKRKEIQDRIIREYQMEEERKQAHRERLRQMETERKTAVLSKIEKKNMMVGEV